MIRPVEAVDLNQLRLIRNKWQKLGLFRQAHDLTMEEQMDWFEDNDNPGFIINERSYGKVYPDNEIAFYGFDEWVQDDLKEFMEFSGKRLYYGEAYQNNCFLTWWIDAGFKVVGTLKNRKVWEGKMYDSLLLEWHDES